MHRGVLGRTSDSVADRLPVQLLRVICAVQGAVGNYDQTAMTVHILHHIALVLRSMMDVTRYKAASGRLIAAGGHCPHILR